MRGTHYTGTTVTFRALESSFYNRTTARRFAWSPKNPQWTVASPHIHQSRVELLLEGIRNERIDVRFNIDTLGITLDPTKLVVYHRPLIDNGRFQPLSTSFDAASRELVVQATTGGEFCFGIPQARVEDVQSPLLTWPVKGERILERTTHAFRVTPSGRVDSIRIQVSRDPAFTSGVIDLTATSDRVNVDVTDATYTLYWRAMAFADNIASVWSAIDSAVVAPAYLDVTRPSTDVQWVYDNAYAVSWKTNISGPVRIELVKNDQVVTLIRDSVFARSQGYLWKVPLTVSAGTEYHVRVSSIDAAFAAITRTGAQNITITDAVSVADDRMMQGPLNGRSMPLDSKEMIAMLAYMQWLGKGVPVGERVHGDNLKAIALLDRPADPVKGRAVYDMHCMRCHGDDGQGVLKEDGIAYVYPPLWGPMSYQPGSSMHRLIKSAQFIKYNMPNDIARWDAPLLTDEEAMDVAAYVNDDKLHRRPQPDLTSEYPIHKEKPLDYFFPPYADPFSADQHKYGPFKPIFAWRSKNGHPTGY